MAKQIKDDEDRLKRQARRRLIGAVALTTAIVVVLPMVLDSEPKQVGQDIELRIPDKDKAGEFVPNVDLQPVSAPVAALAVSQVAAVSAPAVVSPPAPQAAAAALPPAAAPVIPPVKAAAPVPDIKLPVKTAATAPEPKPGTVKHDAKSDQAKPDAKKADQAKHDAKSDQAKPDTRKADQVKSDAKTSQAKPANVARTEQGQPLPQSGFIVQIGAFGNADTAHSWQKNLKLQGFKAYTEKLGDKTRVRIGPYATREEANKARRKLEAKGLRSNIVELN